MRKFLTLSLCLLALGPGVALGAPRTPLNINELMIQPSTGAVGEWLELAVTANTDLQNWQIFDGGGLPCTMGTGRFCYQWTSSYPVVAGEYVILYNQPGTNVVTRRGKQNVHVFYLGNAVGSLTDNPNPGDYVALYNAAGTTCSHCFEYGTKTPCPAACPAPIWSYTNNAKDNCSMYYMPGPNPVEGFEQYTTPCGDGKTTWGYVNSTTPNFVAIGNARLVPAPFGGDMLLFDELFAINHLAYRVYTTASADGALTIPSDAVGPLRPVSKVRQTGVGRTLALPVPELQPGEGVLLEAVDSTGHKTISGPFFPGEAVEEAGAVTSWNPGAHAVPALPVQTIVPALTFKPRSLPAAERLLVGIDRDGVYRLTVAELAAAGLPLIGRPVGAVALTRSGTEVPYYTTAKATFRTTDTIQFTGTTSDSSYSDLTAYLLGPGKRTARLATPPAGVSLRYAPGLRRFETDAIYHGFVPAGSDPWHWAYLSAADLEADAEEIAFDLPDFQPSSQRTVSVEVALWGGASGSSEWELLLNGNPLASGRINDFEPQTVEKRVPAAWLQRGENRLEMRLAAPGAGLVSGFSLDSVTVGYVRSLSLPLLTSAALLRPASTPETVAGRLGAEYVVIAAPGLIEPARRIAALHADEGLSTAVFTTDEWYDAYSHGDIDAAAIQAGARAAWEAGARQMLVLGDDTNDYRDVLGFGRFETVPTPIFVDVLLGRLHSMNRLADFNDDGIPELAVGRIPARSVAEAGAWIDKLAVAADRTFGLPVTFADSSEAIFPYLAGQYSDRLGPEAQLIVGDQAGARAALLSSFPGSSLVSYFGHSGPFGWGRANWLTVADIPAISPPAELVSSWSCFSAMFMAPYGQTLAEQLVLTPDAGALAVFGPLALSDPYNQEPLSGHFLAAVDSQPTIGAAMTTAMRAYFEQDEVGIASRDFAENWVLLGDPAQSL